MGEMTMETGLAALVARYELDEVGLGLRSRRGRLRAGAAAAAGGET